MKEQVYSYYMATTKTFPEIEAMTSIKDVTGALRMGYNCLDSVIDSFKPELKARLDALEHRRRVLTTDAMIARQNMALRRNR